MRVAWRPKVAVTRVGTAVTADGVATLTAAGAATAAVGVMALPVAASRPTARSGPRTRDRARVGVPVTGRMVGRVMVRAVRERVEVDMGSLPTPVR
jgi:hypothetical protein